MIFRVSVLWLWCFAAAVAGQAQFAGFVNKGLVGVGRLPAGSFDRAGDGRQDTLGGFSAFVVEQDSLVYSADRISGRLVGLPDRGFGDGTTDYRPRLEFFQFSITPFYGEASVAQDQITFTNVATKLLTWSEGGTETFFTGFDAGDTNRPAFPRSLPGSLGGGRRALDAEGLAVGPRGDYWISDEYGPALYRFDSQARLQEMILPPPAFLPRGRLATDKPNFTAFTLPAAGRRNNRGFEGLALTPDGQRAVAFLQSPLVQDGGTNYLGRNARIVQFDMDRSSATYGRVVEEYIYQLTMNGTPARDRQTPVSEVLALNATIFLVLERDSLGRGSLETNLAPTYKRLVLASTAGASNIAGSAYDLAPGKAGQLSLPATGLDLPGGLKAAARQDLVDLLDEAQLGRFGLNLNVNLRSDTNSLSEKWEALSLLPLKDPANPDDYLVLVGNDNDFKAQVVYHNGIPVGTNAVPVDLMILAYRVTLPGVGKR